MDYYQEIEKIKKQELQKWFLTESGAKNAYGKLAELSAHKIEQKYVSPHDQKSWDPIDVRLSNVKKDWNADGAYFHGENRFEIDKKSAFIDRNNSLLTAIHEGVHAGQDRAARSAPSRISSQEQDLICNTRYVCERGAFGYATVCDAYINYAAAPGVQLEKDWVRASMHKAQFVEREAYMEAINVGDRLGIDVGHIKHELAQAATALRYEYSLSERSDVDVFRMLDNAQVSFINYDTPKNAIEASMMYDLNIFQREQIAYRSNNFDQQQFIKQMWAPNQKAQVLHDAGFKYAQVIPVYEIANYNIQDIANLSQVARDESPLFMSAAICQYGEEVMKLLDKDSYDSWYFSQDNKLSHEEMKELSKIMGSQYNLGEKAINLDDLSQSNDMNIELDELFVGDSSTSRLNGIDNQIHEAVEAIEEIEEVIGPNLSL